MPDHYRPQIGFNWAARSRRPARYNTLLTHAQDCTKVRTPELAFKTGWKVATSPITCGQVWPTAFYVICGAGDGLFRMKLTCTE
jgi:hypothetical protein